MAKKQSFLKKVIVISAILTAVQVILVVYFRSQRSTQTFSDSANESLSERGGIGIRRSMQVKIQLAVMGFKNRNGRLPNSLDELKPEFIDAIPNDPDTGQPFSYHIVGKQFFVGEEAVAKPTPVPGAATQAGAALTPSAAETPFVYDPTNKRDPFRPFNVVPKVDDVQKTPLERFDLSQFKLTAVLRDAGEPFAMVELADGKGYKVTKGTKIGINNGEVIDIQPGKLVVLETLFDFTGKKTSRTIEIQLRTKEQEGALLRK